MLRLCVSENTQACAGSPAEEVADSVLFPSKTEPARFSLSVDNDTVELRGGYDRTMDDLLITWTADTPLSWVRFLAVGVQFLSDSAPHVFSVYRGVGQCCKLWHSVDTVQR